MAVFLAGLWASPAQAQPTGIAGSNPSTVAVDGTATGHDLQQRQAIRGCPVGQSCQGQLLLGLREFELEAFPRPDQKSPWIEGRGKRRPHTQTSRQLARPSKTFKPSQLRPDLPWLDDLALPDIPVHWDHRVIKYLEFYRYDPRGRNIMTAWLRDQGKFKSLIQRELRRAKLPKALLYISMIESSYDPTVYSRTGASGLWQFMPAGGRIYGLEQDRWLDERNDPERSTRAVMYYFQDLYDRFGNWDLALTAFNAGYGAVIKGIAKYNTNDFWTLLELENALPWESSMYVPKFLAAAIVGANLERFGYHELEVAPALTWDEVTVKNSMPLSTIARAANTTIETIELLNPQLRKGRTPPGKSGCVVRIPRGSREVFSKTIPQLRGDWEGNDSYVVQHGERFEDIAMVHGISRSKLRELNAITSETEVSGGTVLLVPSVTEEEKQQNRLKAEQDLYQSGVPRGKEGDPLLVAVPDPDAKLEGKRRWFYRVVAGDTQSGIASAFQVSRQDLADWNGLDPEAYLHPRMVLQVWTDRGFAPDKTGVAVLDPQRLELVQSGSERHIEIAENRLGRRRRSYSPSKPESLESIGKRFGLTRYDLSRINKMAADTIVAPGESILVYEVIDPDASERASAQAKAAAPRKRKK